MRRAITINLNELYTFRPSLCFTKNGRSILDLIIPYADETVGTTDWLDGMVMGFILNYNWEKVDDENRDPDYPVYLEFLDQFYIGDRDGISDALTCLSDEEGIALDYYISILTDKKESIDAKYIQFFSPFQIVDRRVSSVFDGDKSNLSEVIVYENKTI